MKKQLLLILYIFLSISALFSFKTPASMSFSGSYVLRANGVDAIYWNPANLNIEGYKGDIEFLSLSTSVFNNSIDTNLYNDLMVDSLSQSVKNKLIKNSKEGILLSSNNQMILIAYTKNNIGLSLGSSLYAFGKLDQQMIKLLFEGNEYDQTYTFTHKNTKFNVLAVNDLSISYGGLLLNEINPDFFSNIPNIKYGFTGSFLLGASARSRNVKGYLKSNDDGFDIDQQISYDTGNGYGFKGLLGMSSVVYEKDHHQVSVGLSIDHLFSFFKSIKNCKRNEMKLSANDVYLVNLDDDIYTKSDTTYSINSSSYRFPMKYSLAFLYEYQKYNLSIDITSIDNESAFGSDDIQTSIASEYLIGKGFYVQSGVSFSKSSPFMISYGLEYQGKKWNSGIGFQQFDALIGPSSKGFSFSYFVRYRY